MAEDPICTIDAESLKELFEPRVEVPAALLLAAGCCGCCGGFSGARGDGLAWRC